MPLTDVGSSMVDGAMHKAKILVGETRVSLRPQMLAFVLILPNIPIQGGVLEATAIISCYLSYIASENQISQKYQMDLLAKFGQMQEAHFELVQQLKRTKERTIREKNALNDKYAKEVEASKSLNVEKR